MKITLIHKIVEEALVKNIDGIYIGRNTAECCVTIRSIIDHLGREGLIDWSTIDWEHTDYTVEYPSFFETERAKSDN